MSSGQASNIVGTVLADRFNIVREIGGGAMGAIYEAVHVAVGRRFAVKVLHTEFSSRSARERFFHEARAAGALSHPHIVPVVDFGLLEGGSPYIVMEYVDGETLERVVERDAPLPWQDAVEVCAQLLSALEVIHGAGLVHRDLKPANVMLARVRRPAIFSRLLDFGVSRALKEAWRRPDLTRANEVLGTPAYFSPEQAARMPVSPQWDLWAVGAILYELLSGELPVRLESVGQVINDLLHHNLVPLHQRGLDLPEWLVQVQERSHHKSPAQRFRSATAFLQALDTRDAYPEEQEGDAKTVLFVKVQLETPPPELVGARTPPPMAPPPADPGPGESFLESQVTAPTLPARRQSPQEASAPVQDAADDLAEQDLTVPIVPESLDSSVEHGSSVDSVEDLEDRPLPAARDGDAGAGRAEPTARQKWLTYGLAVAVLLAAGVLTYLALTMI